MPTTEKVIIGRVTDFGRKPRTGRQALIQAHALLTEEGRWTKSTMFEDGDAKEAYEAAACGSWSVCAMGAIGLVTGEMPVSVHREVFYEPSEDDALSTWRDAVYAGETLKSFKDWRATDWDPESHVEHEFEWVFDDCFTSGTGAPITQQAAILLDAVINKHPEDRAVDGRAAVSEVINWNDAGSRTRTQVLDKFAEAIRRAGGEPLVDHNKVKKNVAAKVKAAKAKAAA